MSQTKLKKELLESLNLGDLSNVDLAGATDGQVPSLNTATGNWEASDIVATSVGDDSISTSKIQDGAVTSSKLASSALDFQVMPLVTGDKIIESDSNANGEWIKFANGTMICTKNDFSINAMTQASGNVFRSTSATTWTYPQAFISNPSVSANDLNSAYVWVNCSSAPNQSLVCGFYPSSLSGTRTVSLMAIGRWK